MIRETVPPVETYHGHHARPRFVSYDIPPDHYGDMYADSTYVPPYQARHARRVADDAPPDRGIVDEYPDDDHVVVEDPVTGEEEVVQDDRGWFRRRWDSLRGATYTAPAAFAAWRARRRDEVLVDGDREEPRFSNGDKAALVAVLGLGAVALAMWLSSRGWDLGDLICDCNDNRKSTENGDKFENNPNFLDDREGPRSPDAIDRPDVDVDADDEPEPPVVVDIDTPPDRVPPATETWRDDIASGDGITHTIRDFDIAVDGVQDGDGQAYYAEYERLEKRGFITPEHIKGVDLYRMSDGDFGYASTGRVVLSAEIVDQLSDFNRNAPATAADC